MSQHAVVHILTTESAPSVPCSVLINNGRNAIEDICRNEFDTQKAQLLGDTTAHRTDRALRFMTDPATRVIALSFASAVYRKKWDALLDTHARCDAQIVLNFVREHMLRANVCDALDLERTRATVLHEYNVDGNPLHLRVAVDDEAVEDSGESDSEWERVTMTDTCEDANDSPQRCEYDVDERMHDTDVSNNNKRLRRALSE